MEKITTAFIYFKKKGIKRTLARIKDRYFSVRTFILFQINLLQFTFEEPYTKSVVVKEGTLTDLKQFRNNRKDLPREFYVDATHGGSVFYYVMYEGEWAGICWVFSKGEFSRFFSFSSNLVCELNYIIILPKYRRKQLAACLNKCVYKSLKVKGYEKVVLAMADSNVNMIKSTNHSTDFSELKKVKSYFSFSKKTRV